MADTKTGFVERLARHRWNKPIVWDVLFVLVLPIACLVFDPGIVRTGKFGFGFLSAVQLPTYVLIALLIMAFWVSYLPLRSSFAQRALRGVMIFGVVLSVLFGGALALIAAPMLFGAVFSGNLAMSALLVFGFVPAITADRYIRRLRKLPKNATEQKPGPVLIGFFAPIALAGALYAGTELMLEASFRQLSSSKPDIAFSALQSLADNPLCLSACRSRVIRFYCRRDPAFSSEQFLPLFGGIHGTMRVTEYGCDSV